MTKVTFIESNGKEYVVDAEDGVSAMKAAIDNGVPGIMADCGGSMTCATCHVYVSAEWLAALAPLTETEEAMLECAIDPQANSRLSCQIEVSPALDGLVVHIPASQF